jgi:hypothetical protein
MSEAHLCDAVRTPFGRYGGALPGVRTDETRCRADQSLSRALPVPGGAQT